MEVSTSIMPAKVKGGSGKGKKVAKPKIVLPFLSSDDYHDEHDEYDETPDVPDVLITSTPTTPPESHVESPFKKSKKMRQLTAEVEDDMAELLKDNPCIYKKKLDSYRQTDMKKRLWIDKTKDFSNINVKYLMS